VQLAVAITKNAAQACDIGVGQGTQRRSNPGSTALGRRPLVSWDVKPSTRFSGLRNPIFGANGLRRNHVFE